MKKILGLIILLFLIIGYLYFNRYPENNYQYQGNSVDTRYVNVCGNNFSIQTTKVNNIDVAQKIIESVNYQFEISEEKTKTDCYSVNQNISPNIMSDNLITNIEENEEYYIVSIVSEQSPAFYIGEGYLIDKNNLKIYTRNALDGSQGFEIGILE